jgi:hypothetical protein
MLHESATLLRMDIEAHRRERDDRRMGDAERAGMGDAVARAAPGAGAAGLRRAVTALVQAIVGLV